MTRRNPRLRSFLCSICFEFRPLSEKTLHRCNLPYKCRDKTFCRPCMAKFIEVSIRQGRAKISCPGSLECTEPLDPQMCRELVSEELYSRWCDLSSEGSLLGFDKCYCPNPDCKELIINECGRTRRPRRITCPSCKQQCCFRCALPWDERKKQHKCDGAISFVERKGWTRCPGCKNYVQRSHGCRTIRCRYALT
ncbi:hypothetical protein CDL15_Pgr021360 [Punica granatum]|uniref:RBR-type E3 ubiquitin transferase n=2 Tax=Punica granatum TaxID=22663 RepID=A0A218WR74_PUNGR|nr:hypothetical protein CDL15_Pgr021360 [Punica granatum]